MGGAKEIVDKYFQYFNYLNEIVKSEFEAEIPFCQNDKEEEGFDAKISSEKGVFGVRYSYDGSLEDGLEILYTTLSTGVKGILITKNKLHSRAVLRIQLHNKKYNDNAITILLDDGEKDKLISSLFNCIKKGDR